MIRIASVGAIAVAAASLAACGGSSDPQTSIDTQSTQQQQVGPNGGGQFAQLRSCLKQHGVDLPEGTAGGEGQNQDRRPRFSDPNVRQAIQACRQYLPQGGPPGGGAPGGAPGGTPTPGASS